MNARWATLVDSGLELDTVGSYVRSEWEYLVLHVGTACSFRYGAYAVMVLFEPPSWCLGDASILGFTKGIGWMVLDSCEKDCVENATTADSACNDSLCASWMGLAMALVSSCEEYYLGSAYSALDT